jgi:arylformamidase
VRKVKLSTEPRKQKKMSKAGNKYDLTTPISENTVMFPGDPHFKSEQVRSLVDGASFNLCCFTMGNHTGTHIDFPAHVLEGGKTSSDYKIHDLIGSCFIIEVPDHCLSITPSFVEKQDILLHDFVFFKTSNSRLSKEDKFTNQYVFIEPEAAVALVNKGVKIVGIDYISVDQYEAESLPVHHTLLSNDILIVEGLELSNVPAGRCKVSIMPINIKHMDGLPARVIAEFSTK